MPGRAIRSFREHHLFTALFWLCVVLYVAFVLSLPLFPTGDGPLHIYFANVFWNVARQPGGAYAQVYAVRHLVQPYALHYYLLVALERIVSSNMAEKLFVTLILITQATGFRALAASLAAKSQAVALCVLPLLLNWTLGAGLLNYTFAVGLLLWGIAVYLHLRSVVSARMLAFLAVLALLLLAHPVPLLLLLLLIGGDLFWALLDRAPGAARRALAPRILAFVAACAALVIPLLLADKAQMQSSAAEGIHFHPLWLRYIVSGVRLGLMYLPNPFGWLYLGLLVALLPCAVLAAVRDGWMRRLRARAASPADRLLLSTLLLLLLTLFLPEHLNGSALFADRMWLPIWLLGTAGAAAYLRSPGAQRIVAAAAVSATALALALAVICLRPVSFRQQQLAQAPLPLHARGFFAQAGDSSASLGSRGLNRSTYPLSYWSGARGFFAHHDILLNSPWMNLTIMPVRFRHGPITSLSGALLEDPTKLAAALPGILPALQQADFLLYSDPYAAPDHARAFAQQLLGPSWRCTAGNDDTVCTHAAAH